MSAVGNIEPESASQQEAKTEQTEASSFLSELETEI